MSSGTNKQRLDQNNAKIQQIITTLNNKVVAGSLARIVAAELPNTTIKLYDSNSTLLDTKTTDATTGGKVLFNVNDIGTYTITAFDSNNTQLWTNTVSVTSDNLEYIVKSGKPLSNYTFAEWHTILQGGYFSTMFNLKDTFTYSQSGNILHNHKFFVENITQVGGKEIVDFRMTTIYSGAGYSADNSVGYLLDITSGNWSGGGLSYGGYKYSIIRQKMMEVGEDVYSQATGILPDDYSGTLTTGIKFSDLKYSDTGLTCPIYSYSSSADTMTLLSSASLSAPSNSAMMFIKGYFKNVGQIDETTFNNGVYYIRTIASSAGIYTKATTWVSGTAYYGLYETLQEDGVFASALKTSNFASYLVKFNNNASAGGTQTSMVNSFSDYADISAVEEITGLNRETTLITGNSAQNINAYNLANEGTKKPSYDYSVQAIASEYWTRSAYSGSYERFCTITTAGAISGRDVYTPYGVRLGFRLQ